MIANVVLFSPLRKVFDYKIPILMVKNLQIGVRVKVPFGNKILIGFTIAITDNTNISKEKLKSILEIIDLNPIFPPELYKTLIWAANYYKSSIGGILDCALPKYLKENITPKNNNDNSLKFLEVNHHQEKKDIILNPEQKKIIKEILIKSNSFCVNVLEGVTGSGKTEIYLQLSAAFLAQNKQILILIPEIGLTPQTCKRFIERFKNIEIAILHSRLTPKQRYINWLKAKNGTAKIILGTRTAAFVPLLNPGLFIIDEEHDLSFKQQEHLSYTARDFMIMRAKFCNCQILLGSATPSLETIYNVIQKKYYYYKLPERAISKLPTIEIIDIRHKKLTAGLSNISIATIKQHLEANQQVLLFINRRGFAPIIKCFNCKFICKCDFCDANMIWHIYSNKLHCHHCQKVISIPTLCPKCQQSDLTPIGQGTERIELSFQKIFPNAKIARIDQDSINQKNDFANIINDILNQKFNLLIGTQMIAKGHHFPNLSLVVIIEIDNALFSSDFRSTERLGQLMLQVAGRAGREQPGKVLLETTQPEHKLIQAIKRADYRCWCDILLQERKQAELPPFSYQILWKVEAKTIKVGIEFLRSIKEIAIKFPPSSDQLYKIFGPIPAIMEKRKNKFHTRLLFQSTNRSVLHQLNDLLIQEAINLKLASKVKWVIDVDPAEF